MSPSLPTTTPSGSELREIAVSVQIEGEFFEVLGFMFGLSDMERLVRIDSGAASSGQDEFEGTVLSTSLELTLFTLADLIPFVDEATADGETGDTTDGTTPGGDYEAGDSGAAAGGDG